MLGRIRCLRDLDWVDRRRSHARGPDMRPTFRNR